MSQTPSDLQPVFTCDKERYPAASIAQAFSIRRLCASGCLAESIQLIKFLCAIGVRSLHLAFAIGVAARALRSSVGTLGSDSSPARLGFSLFIIAPRKRRTQTMLAWICQRYSQSFGTLAECVKYAVAFGRKRKKTKTAYIRGGGRKSSRWRAKRP